MKRKMRISLLFVAVCAALFSSCAGLEEWWNREDTVSVSHSAEEKTATVERAEADLVAIRVLKTDGEDTLADVMAYLRAESELAFSKDASGMITGINGKENPADWSYCWMLYTSDTEMANSEWGSVEYAGQTLGGAVLGANSLPVVAGEIYVWAYTKIMR